MRNVFIVTGASGFLGSTICKQLLENNVEVRTLSRSVSTSKHIPNGVKIYPGNILSPDSIDPLFDNDSNEEINFVVIHCASNISVTKHDPKTYVINVEGTKNMVRAAKDHHAARFVYIGSVDALYNPKDGSIISEPETFHLSKPDSDYARSKCEASAFIMNEINNGLNAIIIMPSCILGPGDYKGGFVSVMFSLYIRGIPPFSIKGGYDFVDVRDVASYTIKAAVTAPKGSVYILSGHYLSVTDVFDTMAKCLKRHKTIFSFPTWIVLPLAPFMNSYMKANGKDSVLTINSVGLLASEAVFSHERATKELNYHPRPITNTIIDSMKFIMKEGMTK